MILKSLLCSAFIFMQESIFLEKKSKNYHLQGILIDSSLNWTIFINGKTYTSEDTACEFNIIHVTQDAIVITDQKNSKITWRVGEKINLCSNEQAPKPSVQSPFC